MKKIKIVLIIALLTSIVNIFAQNVTGYQKITHYPFTVNGNDTTGNYGAATVSYASFTQGSMYSNGVYYGNSATGTHIITPNISAFDESDFIIKLDFTNDSVPDENILMCGGSWRWLSFSTNLTDSSLVLSINDGAALSFTNYKILPNTWYSLGVQYDSTTKVLDTYINNNLIKTTTLTTNFNYHNNFQFTNENGGSGVCHKGRWKNLVIYKQQPTGVEIFQNANLISVYPNPSRGNITVETKQLKTKKIILTDLTGKRINYKSSSNNEQTTISNLPQGIYLLSVISADKIYREKIIIQ